MGGSSSDLSTETSKREDYIGWDDYFMATAFLAAKRSKDPVTQVGACIVNNDNRIVGVGYNGMPTGCHDNRFPWGKGNENRLENKHLYVCHAEMNAILNKNTADVKDCRMFVAMFPCNECSKFIIQSGIKQVIYMSDKHAHKVSTIASKKMLDAAGVKYCMTDSMNFGPEWLRNLSSEGSTGGTAGGGTRYQLADYRYGREEMLALFEKGLRAPNSLSTFSPLFSDQVLPPLALLPHSEEERVWQSRSISSGPPRGRGGISERGRITRGRPYQPYNRGGYDGSGGWSGSNENTEWSPRKEYNSRNPGVDNWRRNRNGDEEDGWRSNNQNVRASLEKWGRQTSWRDGDGSDERGPPERPTRSSWQDGMRGPPHRRPWDNEDHLPEWATENPSESGGSFDSSGAFHGSDDERDQKSSQPVKKEIHLQKSVSQQNIAAKPHPTVLPSSHSAITLTKPPDDINVANEEKKKDVGDSLQTEIKQRVVLKIESRSSNKPIEYDKEQPKQSNHIQIETTHNHPVEKQIETTNLIQNSIIKVNTNGIQGIDSNNKVDEEFERMQEDLVTKLVVDEETPKRLNVDSYNLASQLPNTLQPSAATVQEKWYYQDPQGDLQGPFLTSEMGEWYRAGYFTSQLLVKRVCDDNFFRLGDLVTLYNGNPFIIRSNSLKTEIPPLRETDDLLQYQHMIQTQLAFRQAATMRALNSSEPWSGLPTMPQGELLPQQVLSHPQIPSEMQYLQQQTPPSSNPLMHMISQMQQANKLSGLVEKPPTAVPSQMDPLQALVQRMGGLHSAQNNLQSGPAVGLPTTIPNSVGLSSNLHNNGLSTNLASSGLLNSFPNLPLNNGNGGLPVSLGLPNTGGLLVGSSLSNTSSMDTLQSGLPSTLSDSSTLPPRPNPLGAVDPLSATNENETIKNLLRQIASKQQSQQLDSLWQQNQYANSQTKPQQQSWHPNDVPRSMWDLQTPSSTPNSVPSSIPAEKSAVSSDQLKVQEKEKQKQLKEEQRKKQELEEKQAKKEAEERRREEQRKQEAEKKAAEEKRKKEEERIKKELEKIRKLNEEKKLRDLEEKRRNREQQRAEEEARRKMEEQRRLEEIERARREAKERDEQLRKQIEVARHENNKVQRAAPWSQANSTPELSLADIQKAEREKRAEQAALMQQQKVQLHVLQEQQTSTEKQVVQFNWTKKPSETRKVKSLAEIQQEEQDRMVKQAAETRLAAQQKEKETLVTVTNITVPTPWSTQNLTWANTTSQWNNTTPSGFWDESSLQKVSNKPSSVSKSNSSSAVNTNKHPVKQNKSKTKKEEQQVMKIFSNGPATNEFMQWCTESLKELNSTVDIPTFISFLRDIESAMEVKDYCKEYLGDGPMTHQFATQFLERRRVINPKILTEKDDLSSPAPALTPLQHCTDFQEVKGKGKKTKKSKMTKIDARILGFSVTAAPDRINVGDRDYVEH